MFRNLVITIILVGALVLIYLYRNTLILYIRAILAGIPLGQVIRPTPSGNTPSLPVTCTGGGEIQNKSAYAELQKNGIGSAKFECKDAPFVAGGYGVWSLQPVPADRLPEALQTYYVRHPRNGLYYPEINLIQKFYAPQGKKRKWYYDYIYDYIGTFPLVDIFKDKTSLGLILNDNLSKGNDSWSIILYNSWQKPSPNNTLTGYKQYTFPSYTDPNGVTSPSQTFAPRHVINPFLQYANNYMGATIYGTGDLWKRTNTSALETYQPYDIVLNRQDGNHKSSDNCDNQLFINTWWMESAFGELFWKNKIDNLQGKNIYGMCFNNGPSDLLKENLQGESLIGFHYTPVPVKQAGYMFSQNYSLNKGYREYPVIIRADNKQGGKIDQYFYA